MSLDLYFRKKKSRSFPVLSTFPLAPFRFFYLKNSPRYIVNSRCPGRIVGTFTASVNDTGGHTHTVPESYINRQVNDACGYLRHRCKQHCPFTSVQYSDFLYSVFFIHCYVAPFFSLHRLFLSFHMSGLFALLSVFGFIFYFVALHPLSVYLFSALGLLLYLSLAPHLLSYLYLLCLSF